MRDMAQLSAKRFEQLRVALFALTILFCLQGLSWMVIGSFDPFGFYDGLLAQWLFGTSELPAAAEATLAFALIPFGATDAAYFALSALVIHHGFGRRERWAWNAVAGSFALWFVTDTGLCLVHGAVFNIVVVNVPCAVFYGIPLLLIRRGFTASAESA